MSSSREQIVELASARIILGQQLVDFVVKDVALLLAGVHQLL